MPDQWLQQAAHRVRLLKAGVKPQVIGFGVGHGEAERGLHLAVLLPFIKPVRRNQTTSLLERLAERRPGGRKSQLQPTSGSGNAGGVDTIGGTEFGDDLREIVADRAF